MITDSNLTKHYGALAPKMQHWLVAGGVKKETAEELIQETFLRVWRKRDTLKENTSPAALFWTVLRNLRIDFFRRQKPTSSLDDPEGAFALEVPAPPVLNTLDEDYLHERIQCAVQKLSPAIRETFHLFFEEHYSIKEIAAQMGVGESLVKVRIHRARQRLQHILKDLHEPPFV